MMPTKIGSYGSSAGYGAGGTPVASIYSVKAHGDLAAKKGVYWTPGKSGLMLAQTKYSPQTLLSKQGGARTTSTYVNTRTGQLATAATPYRGSSSVSALPGSNVMMADLRANLATGYSFPTDDQMYNGVGGKGPAGAVPLDSVLMNQRPLWQYLLGAVVVGGGGYWAWKRFGKSKRVSA